MGTGIFKRELAERAAIRRSARTMEELAVQVEKGRSRIYPVNCGRPILAGQPWPVT
jgi:hypothetical protein